MGNIEHWEYQSWTIYGVCQGCGAANASMHALNCSRPGREDVKVVPASQLRGAVEALDEALDLAAEALDVPAGYARHLKHLRERTRTLRGVQQ
jgi:hypothetical protein